MTTQTIPTIDVVDTCGTLTIRSAYVLTFQVETKTVTIYKEDKETKKKVRQTIEWAHRRLTLNRIVSPTELRPVKTYHHMKHPNYHCGINGNVWAGGQPEWQVVEDLQRRLNLTQADAQYVASAIKRGSSNDWQSFEHIDTTPVKD